MQVELVGVGKAFLYKNLPPKVSEPKGGVVGALNYLFQKL
jgi:hypothetical protein